MLDFSGHIDDCDIRQTAVPALLREAAELYEQRNKLYGDNYKKFGHAFWPFLQNIQLKGPKDLNRLGILVQILAKVSRYCENFNEGGHDDSLQDITVYSAMLRELDAND